MSDNSYAYKLLLSALRFGIQGKSVCWKKPVSQNSLSKLFSVAREHSVLPIVVHSVYANYNKENCETDSEYADNNSGTIINATNYAIVKKARKKARRTVIRQSQRTADFLLLYEYLATNNLHPIVLKGIICRDLYPNPEQRPSVDEDLLILPSQIGDIHRALISYGLSLVDPTQDIYMADEVSYQNLDNHLYIEVHKHLFPDDSDVYGDLNRFFVGAENRCVQKTIYGTQFFTLGYTDHLVYLILHVYKHFLHSGFGIRQVCDIILYSEKYV